MAKSLSLFSAAGPAFSKEDERRAIGKVLRLSRELRKYLIRNSADNPTLEQKILAQLEYLNDNGVSRSRIIRLIRGVLDSFDTRYGVQPVRDLLTSDFARVLYSVRRVSDSQVGKAPKYTVRQFEGRRKGTAIAVTFNAHRKMRTSLVSAVDGVFVDATGKALPSGTLLFANVEAAHRYLKKHGIAGWSATMTRSGGLSEPFGAVP